MVKDCRFIASPFKYQTEHSMMITDEQVKELNIYLAGILKYQETVDEIADHIISSLEGMETDMAFSKAITEIINNDFNGTEGLAVMEQESQQLISKNLNNCLNSHFWAYLKFPKILHVLALFSIFYYAFSTYKFTAGFLLIAFYLLASIPSVMYFTRCFYSGYYSGSTKKSIKDRTLARLGSSSMAIANALLWCLLNELGKPQVNDFISSYPSFVSFLFVLLSVQVLSFLQLNQREINKYMVKR